MRSSRSARISTFCAYYALILLSGYLKISRCVPTFKFVIAVSKASILSSYLYYDYKYIGIPSKLSSINISENKMAYWPLEIDYHQSKPIWSKVCFDRYFININSIKKILLWRSETPSQNNQIHCNNFAVELYQLSPSKKLILGYCS